MPTRTEGSRKRYRPDAGEAGPSDVVTRHTSSANDIPPWFEKLCNKALMQTGDNVRQTIRKTIAIDALEEHIANSTCPASLQLTTKIMVSAVHQEEMNNTVQAAAQQFHGVILHQLLTIRQKELETLKSELPQIDTNLKDDIQTILTQMYSEKLLTGSIQDNMDKLMTEHNERRDKRILHIRTASFHQRKKKLEDDALRQQRKAAMDVEETLKDKDVTALQQKLKVLETKIQVMSKKGQGRPTKKTHTPRPAKKKNAPKAKTGRPQAQNTKGKSPQPGKPVNRRQNPAHGNENRNPDGPSKSSTSRLVSKKKRSQPRRN